MVEFVGVTVTPESFGDYLRITGSYTRSSGSAFDFHFVIPKRYADWIAPHTDGWYLLGVAAAFTLGEDYRHNGDVSPKLIRNSKSLIRQWHAFFPRRRLIKVHGATSRELTASPQKGDLVACLFTGGVDSAFTFAEKVNEVDVALLASFRFTAEVDYSYIVKRQQAYEASTHLLGVESLAVGNNLLSVLPEWGEAWSYLTHGAALVGMCHLLAGRIGMVSISSSHSYGELIPWGSHPLTDNLLSSDDLAVEHYGTEYSRFDKVAKLASHPNLLKNLSVCGKPPGQKNGLINCSECQKCVRTMAALDLSGVDKQECTSFDWSNYSPDKVSKVTLHHPNEYIFFEELIEAGRTRGRDDVSSAADVAIRRSSKFKPLVAVEGYLRRSFPAVGRMPVLAKAKKRFYSIVRQRST